MPHKPLATARTITLPKPDDQVWIITTTLRLVGVFSATLRGSQANWLHIPCEIDALTIASGAKHLSTYLIKSHEKACILTDSKPCMHAYRKAHMSTFLSTVGRYQTSVGYFSGSVIPPSNLASRKAAPCCHAARSDLCCIIQASTLNLNLTPNFKSRCKAVLLPSTRYCHSILLYRHH